MEAISVSSQHSSKRGQGERSMPTHRSTARFIMLLFPLLVLTIVCGYQTTMDLHQLVALAPDDTRVVPYLKQVSVFGGITILSVVSFFRLNRA